MSHAGDLREWLLRLVFPTALREEALQGVSRRRFQVTTVRDETACAAQDLVRWDFTATRRDQLWGADITYVPTWTGFLYLAAVLDALEMAVHRRQLRDVVHQSDHGCQYTSIAFDQCCREADVWPSMGSVGDSYDNAPCESFFASLECELLNRRSFPNHFAARSACFESIEGGYNPH